MSTNPESDLHLALLLDWWNRCRASQHSHHDAGKVFQIMSWVIEGPSVVVPIALGGMALAFLGNTLTDQVKIIFGFLGAITSLLSILHMYFRFHERSISHQKLGAEYGVVRRDIEMSIKHHLENKSGTDATKTSESMASIQEQLDTLGLKMPVVPTLIFGRTIARLKRDEVPKFLQAAADQAT